MVEEAQVELEIVGTVIPGRGGMTGTIDSAGWPGSRQLALDVVWPAEAVYGFGVAVFVLSLLLSLVSLPASLSTNVLPCVVEMLIPSPRSPIQTCAVSA
jgi:hypothetical protein